MHSPHAQYVGSWTLVSGLYNCVQSLVAGLKFSPSQKFAGGGQVRPIRERFDHRLTITDITSYVVGMDLFFRRWDGRPVLGGIIIHMPHISTLVRCATLSYLIL